MSEIALQYDGDEDSYYICVGDNEMGPLSERECERVEKCLSTHFR